MICPACSNRFDEQTVPRREYPLRGKEQDGRHPSSIVFCPTCELGMAWPAPVAEQMDEYNAAFWETAQELTFEPKRYPNYYALAKARWAQIERNLIEKSGEHCELALLDIGAGHGFLGWAAARSGKVQLKEYTAVEPDHTFRQSLENTWRRSWPSVKFFAFASLPQVPGRFDLVVLSHVLEHLPDPRPTLESVREKLSPNGMVFIEVPNQDYRFKQYLFPHVLFFNRQSLETLVRGSGLMPAFLGGFGRRVAGQPSWDSERLGLLTKSVLKLKGILPVDLVADFLNRDLCADRRNEEGTWLRLLAGR